jgi:endonuclease/exonuclease/phosphatase family metal-dependent hydrolase
MNPATPGHERSVRIATFNILNGRAPDSDEVDEGRFAEAVSTLDADLLGLQEVDRNQPRSRHADLTALAAEAMGAVDHRFTAALSGTPGTTWSAATGDEQPDSAAYGVAFLSRYPVTGWREVRLPPVPVKAPYRFHGARRATWVRDEPRVAVVAGVETPVGHLEVVTTHLSFLPWWSGRQLRLLMRALGDDAPLVLLGDLNMLPARAHSLTGLHPLVSGATFPTSRPTRQIDHVLGRGDLPPARGGPVRLPVSDHWALVAETTDR